METAKKLREKIKESPQRWEKEIFYLARGLACRLAIKTLVNPKGNSLRFYQLTEYLVSSV